VSCSPLKLGPSVGKSDHVPAQYCVSGLFTGSCSLNQFLPADVSRSRIQIEGGLRRKNLVEVAGRIRSPSRPFYAFLAFAILPYFTDSFSGVSCMFLAEMDIPGVVSANIHRTELAQIS
jgi:hypothetical protein